MTRATAHALHTLRWEHLGNTVFILRKTLMGRQLAVAECVGGARTAVGLPAGVTAGNPAHALACTCRRRTQHENKRTPPPPDETSIGWFTGNPRPILPPVPFAFLSLCLPFPSNTGGLLMATSTPRALLRTHACEVSSEKKLRCEQGRTMAGAGRGKKGSFVTSVARTSPEEKLFLVRRAFPRHPQPPPPPYFSCVVLTEEGNVGSDTQAAIYSLVRL